MNGGIKYYTKKLFVTALALISWSVCCAQTHDSVTRVYFNLDKFDVVPSLRDNEANLKYLIRLLDNIEQDDSYQLISIEIDGNCSPEAGVAYNIILSQNRAASIKNYITERHDIADSLFITRGEGIAWELLYTLVVESDMQYKDEVLWILDNVEEETWRKGEGDRWSTLVDSRLKQLMDLRGGAPYRWMLRELFPTMRNSGVVTVTYSVCPPPIANVLETNSTKPEMPMLSSEVSSFASPASEETPILAIKTNLIYDLASALNFEIEVPIGNRFSVTGEFINPWWHIGSADYTMRVHMGTVGGKYWLGNREDREVLTGWAVGANVGFASDYDVQLFDEQGIQGTYFMGGATIGYAHTLYKKFYLEYQLGLGVMESDYQNYTMAYDTEHGDVKVFDYPWVTKRHL